MTLIKIKHDQVKQKYYGKQFHMQNITVNYSYEKLFKVHLLFVSSADRITFEEVSKRLQCTGEEQYAFLERAIFLLLFLFTASGSTDLFTWRRHQINKYKSLFYFIS
jgi:hypothetical protein